MSAILNQSAVTGVVRMSTNWHTTTRSLLELAYRPGTPHEGEAAFTGLERFLARAPHPTDANNVRMSPKYRDCLCRYRQICEQEPRPAPRPAPQPDHRHTVPGYRRTHSYKTDTGASKPRVYHGTCEWCGMPFTWAQPYAGNPPRYCDDRCQEDRRRMDARERMRANRARKRRR